MVEHTDFVSLPTQDMARARTFYGDTLGLTMSHALEDRFSEFETGNLTLVLMDPTSLGQEFRPANGGSVALRVDDVHAERARLEALGVTFFGDVIDTGVCHMSPFADPDGNALLLHRRYAPKD
jgi:predicted enzyme related to lactoylglutathione lyase